MSSHFPKSEKMIFHKNTQTGYYEKQPEMIPSEKIPNELKIEYTQRKDIKKYADKLIRGKEKTKTGNWVFYTGLMQTFNTNWYYGNIRDIYRGKHKNNLIIFRFNADYSIMHVFYFKGYDKDNITLRERFVNEIIPSLKYVHFL